MTTTAHTQTIEVVSPVDGSLYVRRTLAGPDAIDGTLANAAASQELWRRVPLAERIAICRRMVAWMVERADDLGAELAWQMGRPIAHAPGELRRGFRERATHMADIAASALADLDAGSDASVRRFIRREPLGVVLVLAPWNYPYLCSVNTVVPAVLAGNSVVLKVASQTPLVAERYAEAFKAAGLPDGVFQFLHLSHDDVANVIGDRRVAFVAFTGSVAGGQHVQRAVGGRSIPTGLELGGKDPAYVRADADIDYTVPELVDASFFNAGQSCCGVERIYVHRSLFDTFVDRFVGLTRQYKLGDPLDAATTLGPMVRTAAADAVRGQVTDAVAQGAHPLIDERDFEASLPGTPYLAPQVLVDVNHRMAIMTEETFGPAVGVMSVNSDEEAIALMNDSRYGLTASIWTRDADAALAIGDRIDTGTWFMNRSDYLDPRLAWTGVKDSGRGCTLSPLGFEALTRPKSFYLQLRPAQ
jgi:acyl-CoA reductase-like NAD-dependent aldehyde dehydrogenase